MENITKVYVTKEVAEMVGLTTSYFLRFIKKMKEEGKFADSDMRQAGPRTYLFNQRAVREIKIQLEKNKRK